MAKIFFPLFLSTLLSACITGGELKSSKSIENADEFTKEFVKKVISGGQQEFLKDIDSGRISQTGIQSIRYLHSSLRVFKMKDIHLVEMDKKDIFTSDQLMVTKYSLRYQYDFESEIYVFLDFDVRQTGDDFKIADLTASPLSISLQEANVFSLKDKSIRHYVFFSLFIAIALFILITFIKMLLSSISVLRKIIVGILILFFAIPQFHLNWITSEFSISFFNFNALGVLYIKQTPFHPSQLTFGIPIGALIFWYLRDHLVKAKVVIKEEEDRIDNQNLG